MTLEEKHIRWILFGIGAVVLVSLMVLEVIAEPDGVRFLDLAVDSVQILLAIAALIGVVLVLLRMHYQHEEKMALIRDLGIARAVGDRWRSKLQSHIDGLKAGLDAQFREWGLTGAECEVGLLILKGLSHRDIATVRKTTEATVRQQAQSIYRKAGLPGKAAFSGYFLEDLLPSEAILNGGHTESATRLHEIA